MQNSKEVVEINVDEQVFNTFHQFATKKIALEDAGFSLTCTSKLGPNNLGRLTYVASTRTPGGVVKEFKFSYQQPDQSQARQGA